MKYPLSIPSTPVKRRHVARCAAPLAAALIAKKIDEGSFYNIYLTKDQTVLRIAKRRESGELEASILGMVCSDHINRMIHWWCEDGFSHFEMEYCPGGNLARQFGEYRRVAGPACAPACEQAEAAPAEPRRGGRASGPRRVSCSAQDGAQPSERALDSFSDIDTTLEQNTSSIYMDNDSESSDLPFMPEDVDAPAWAARMMHQISQALSAVHKAGVVHMDVRPDNILRSGAGYKLCDFNISRIGEGAVDRDGDFVYMAPEVLKNRCYYASDVYSLGMVYLELCNPDQPLPHEGEAHRRIRRNDFRGWRVDGIGRMMLEKNPVKRCSAEHVSRHFEGLL